MAQKNGSTLAMSSMLMLGLVVGGLILANFIVHYASFGRLDLTENRVWSLSDGSRDLVAGLGERMEVTAYFTENLPPPFNSTEQYVRDLLEEYEAASGGKLVVRFINPEEEEDQSAAEEDGVRRVAHQVIENDAVSVREGYRGLVIEYLGEKKTIAVIQDPTGLEYTITMAIKELAEDPRPIGVVTGHEGPTLEEGLGGLREALPTYTLTGVNANEEIDPDLAALLIIGPETAFTETELQRIDQYVMRGGSLGVFGGNTKLGLEGPEPSVEAADTGINELLTAYGVRVNTDVVMDAQCSRAPWRHPSGIQLPVQYPPVPILSFTDEQQEHNAIFRIQTAVMPFTSSLELTTAPAGVSVEVLGRTSENSWREAAGTSLAVRHPSQWRFGDDKGPFPLLVAAQGRLPSAFANAPDMSTSEAGNQIEAPDVAEGDARVFVAGTASFLRDEFLPQPQPGMERDLSGALSFALNAIDWLAADADLIAIRAKNIEDPVIEVPAVQAAEDEIRSAVENQDQDEVDEGLERRNAALEAWDSKKAAYRWLNTLGIPFVFGIFGVFRWQGRKRRRKNLKL